jgi:hypothetical protein
MSAAALRLVIGPGLRGLVEVVILLVVDPGLTGGYVSKEVEGADTFLDFLGAFLQLDVLPFSFLFLHIRKVSTISL